MGRRRSPWLTLVSALVYLFLYAPIVVLVVFAFNASRTRLDFSFKPVNACALVTSSSSSAIVVRISCLPIRHGIITV